MIISNKNCIWFHKLRPIHILYEIGKKKYVTTAKMLAEIQTLRSVIIDESNHYKLLN